MASPPSSSLHHRPAHRRNDLPQPLPPSSIISSSEGPVFNYRSPPLPPTLWPPPSLCPVHRPARPILASTRTETSAKNDGESAAVRILSHGMRAKRPRVRLTDYDSLIGRNLRPADRPRRGHLGSPPLRRHNNGCRSISKAAHKPDISFLPRPADGGIVTCILVKCVK